MSTIPIIPQPNKANFILACAVVMFMASLVALYIAGTKTGELTEKIIKPTQNTVRYILHTLSEMLQPETGVSTTVTNSVSVSSDVRVNSSSSGTVRVNVGGTNGITVDSNESDSSYTVEINGVPQIIYPSPTQ